VKSINISLILVTIFLISVPACASQSGSTPETDRSRIIGTTWLWERYDDTAGINNIVVEDPSQYTLLLKADGTYQLKADCNLANGSYTIEESSITFEPGPTTLAECGPDSLYNAFLMKFEHVATYVMDGDKLFLNLWADAGNLVFVPSSN
jgi:heat shock protein HslJ